MLRTPIAALALTLSAGLAQAQATFFFEQDQPYLSTSDIPAGFYEGDMPAFLDNLEDDSLGGGLAGSAGGVIEPRTGAAVDSVAADSSGIGRSWFNGNGTAGVTFTFSGPVLPTAFALVVTDASGGAIFSAYDAAGALIGSITRTGFLDGTFNGGTAEDRFFGVTFAAGIAAIRAQSSGGGGIELDHIQVGTMVAVVPEPGAGALLAAGLATLASRLRWRRRD